MNPSKFSGSKVMEDPNKFMDKVYDTPAVIGLTS